MNYKKILLASLIIFNTSHILKAPKRTSIREARAANALWRLGEMAVPYALNKFITQKATDHGFSPVQVALLGTAGSVTYIAINFFAQKLLFKIYPYAEKQGPETQIVKIVNDICTQNQIQKVDVYVAEAPSPLPLQVCGHNTIFITRGALEDFTGPHLKALMAHELGHIKHGDPLTCLYMSAIIILINNLLEQTLGPVTMAVSFFKTPLKVGNAVVNILQVALYGCTIPIKYSMEYAADRFAIKATKELAVSKTLFRENPVPYVSHPYIDILSLFATIEAPFVSRLTHPSPKKRIEAIKTQIQDLAKAT